MCKNGYTNNFSENEEAITKIILHKHNQMIKKYNEKIEKSN